MALLILRESNNTTRYTSKRPNPRHRPCFATPRSGHITTPRPNSSLARQWGNITMPHLGNTLARYPDSTQAPRPSNTLALHRVNPAPRQIHPRSASGPQQPNAVSGSTPVPHRAHNIPALPRGPSQEPRNKKSVRIATFLRLAIVASSQSRIAAQKRSKNGIFQAWRNREELLIAKKLQRYRVFCFLQWVRSLQQGKSRENARSIMTSNPKSETRKAPAMRTPQEKLIRLKSTLPWHHTARNKHRVQPSTYRRSPLRPELRGCTGAR